MVSLFGGAAAPRPHQHHLANSVQPAPTRASSHSSEIFNQPPKMVIRAIRDYKAQFINELEFRRGDFFFVIHALDDFYYEVMDPVKRVRGLVPRSHFDTLDKVGASATPKAAAKPEFRPPKEQARPSAQPEQQPDRYHSRAAEAREPDADYDYHRPSHVSAAPTASTTTNYDDYKHQSAYTHASDHDHSDAASSATHSSAYSSVDEPTPLRSPPLSPHSPTRRIHPQHHSQQEQRLPPVRDQSVRKASLPSIMSPGMGGGGGTRVGMGGQLPVPVTARVQNDELLQDGRFQYTVELHLSDDTSRVLHRSWDDFYTMHVSLLTQYDAQAGRTLDTPRVIPFLPPAPARAKLNAPLPAPMSPSEQGRRRDALDTYLSDLVQLPAPIRQSAPLNRFFMLRKGDNTISSAVKFDSSAALMDLISDYHSYPSLSRGSRLEVRIKLHLPGDETLAWRIYDNMPFLDFVEEVASKVGRMHNGWALWYKDEVGGLVKIMGDVDWSVVIRGRWEKVVLYID
ncbi:bud emergence protein 1 [Thoreauomyces humboldtii]|nr:bud emergence protein 1 [Thoreauomyces humboldtii]